MLKKLKQHPHLIQLFATYEHQGKWHLILPYADADLRTYWEERAIPKFDQETVLWSVRQMWGIADGLFRVHVFKPTHPLQLDGGVRVQDDARLSVQPGEELFGRHGDFKPENILWFSSDLTTKDEQGILKIADFGLGRFHGRESRSISNPQGKAHSPTYEPPELRLGIPVSRAYDFWSLGCVYLEFITWLLKGNAALDEFSRNRLEPHNQIRSFRDDIFFTMRSGEEAEIREGVKLWVRKLRQHECCSGLIHDLLDLVIEQMLRIDPQARIEAGELSGILKKMVEKAESDHEYLQTPRPRNQADTSPTQSASSGSGAQSKNRQREVHFED